MIPHTDLTMHDGFSFPCNHVDLDDDEFNDDTYWLYFDHQWEEGSHMLVEEVVNFDLGDNPKVLKMVQFGNNIQAYKLAKWILEIKKRIKVFSYA